MTQLRLYTRTASVTPASTVFIVDIGSDVAPNTKSILGDDLLADLVAAIGPNGIDVTPVGDADADLITVGVTGGPKLWWDESEDSFRLTNRVFIGSSTISGDTMLGVYRAVNDDIAGNAHCFSDSSVITRSGAIGYNSYNCIISVSGTENYDHFASFQNAPVLNTSGTTTNLYGFFDLPTVSDGILTNRYGVYVAEPSKTGDAVITNNYGVYVAELTEGGTLNYAIRTAGATMSYFGGAIGVGTTPDATRPIFTAGAHADVTLYGVQNSTSNTGNIVGFNSLVSTSGSAAIALHIDLYAQGVHGSTGLLTNRYNVYCAAVGNAGCNTTTRSGVYVIDQTGSGTLVNQYGLRVAALSKGSTLNYAIYTEGATASLFEGPLHFKNVAGPSALTDGAVIYATDQAAGNSCIHAKTEGGAVIKLFQSAHIADSAGDDAATVNAILDILEATGLMAAA